MKIEWERQHSDQFSDWYVAIPYGTAAICRTSKHHMWEVFVMDSTERDALAGTLKEAKRKAKELLKDEVMEKL